MIPVVSHLVRLGLIWFWMQMQSLIVAIPQGNVSLDTITIVTPGCDKNCKVAVFFKSDAVVTIPSVKYSFAAVGWNYAGLVKWRLCVVYHANCVSIE